MQGFFLFEATRVLGRAKRQSRALRMITKILHPASEPGRFKNKPSSFPQTPSSFLGGDEGFPGLVIVEDTDFEDTTLGFVKVFDFFTD